MKRSEMKKLFKDIISMYRNTSSHFISDEGIAEVLLSVAENKGMLPPYNPQHLDHGSIVDCEWTPEIEIKELPDETK